jgi:hypothetical protein
MAITGTLGEVSIADLMQFIHFGRRSGSLRLLRDGQEARFGFVAGKLVGARAPRTPNLGDVLLRRGAVAPETLLWVVEVQRRLPQATPLGQLLLQHGSIGPRALRAALEEQISLAVGEALGWEDGTFEFVPEEPTRQDDFEMSWTAALPDFGLNPERLLLEAARLFDERSAGRGAAAEEEDDDPTLPIIARDLIAALEAAAGAGAGAEAAGGDVDPDEIGRLRHVYGTLRAGFVSATISLSLMHVVSESFERAVLFLVRSGSLLALGAFGHDVTGRSLAERTRGLELPLDDDSILARSARTRQPCRAAFADAGLPPVLAAALGAPRSGEAVALPVAGSGRVIAVVYADNGDLPATVRGVDILDLAATQVGLALENELLRRRVEALRAVPAAPDEPRRESVRAGDDGAGV